MAVNNNNGEQMEKFEITDLASLKKVEDEHYPDGIRVARKKDFFNDGSYIGFHLDRYGYNELLAAEIHAARDLLNGRTGASYGAEFKPYVVHHKEDDGSVWYEVYTG